MYVENQFICWIEHLLRNTELVRKDDDHGTWQRGYKYKASLTQLQGPHPLIAAAQLQYQVREAEFLSPDTQL